MLLPQDRLILDLVVDDAFGLWELVWRLRTALEVSAGPPVNVARDAVERLRRSGLVELWVREWTDDEPVPLRESDRDIELAEQGVWAEPGPNEPQILVVATELGRSALWADGDPQGS